MLAALLDETGAAAIHVTRGYEPWEPELEAAVSSLCEKRGVAFRTFSGRLLFEPETIVTGDGRPYRVFTPFWKACLAAPPPRAPLPVPTLDTVRRRQERHAGEPRSIADASDWAGGLRDTWQTGEAAARRVFGASSTIISRATPTTAAASTATPPRGSRRISISAR